MHSLTFNNNKSNIITFHYSNIVFFHSTKRLWIRSILAVNFANFRPNVVAPFTLNSWLKFGNEFSMVTDVFDLAVNKLSS